MRVCVRASLCNGAGSTLLLEGGARLMVSAACGKTCIFFIQDKILLGGRRPHPDY